MKKTLLLLIIIVLTNSILLSQQDTNKICFTKEVARLIALDLRRLDYLDSAIIRKDSVIALKDTIIITQKERLSTVENEKFEAIEQLEKEKPKKKRWGIVGIILGLMSQLLF